MPPKKKNTQVKQLKQTEQRVTRSTASKQQAVDNAKITTRSKNKHIDEDPKPTKKESKAPKNKKAKDSDQDYSEVQQKQDKKPKQTARKSTRITKNDKEDSPQKPKVKTAQKQKTEPVKKQEIKPITTSDKNEDNGKGQDKQLKKIVLKGSIPVDQHFSKPHLYKIYADEEKIYASTLNQSNIDANNNKFYIIQLLQAQNGQNNYILFTRWGRVGVQGQFGQSPFKNMDVAKKQYNKKLNQKLKKSYRLVQMNYQQNAEEDKQDKVQKKDGPTSTLDERVQNLIRLIFDMKMMAQQMKQIGYDANKMPLGKLAKSSILKGYQILKQITDELTKGNMKEVKTLSGSFYSQIPHNFGFQNMQNFVLDTQKKVKDKLEMLQSLQDIQVFTKLLDEGNVNSDMNQLDSNYLKLNMKITPLQKSTSDYKLLQQYVKNTHASTHTAYKLQIQDIFQLEKEVELTRYKKEIQNKQLLWHGSRLTNFVGILSQGLRIAPPEAPVTGYMFGKGVYFADMVTKSANYCFASKQNSTGLMLLCEVALGQPNEKLYADYYANLLPQGKHSTKGCGKTAPRQGKMLGDVLVPCGVGQSTGVQSSLLYNEYIVYDVAQIKCRYLFKMKFCYK